MTSHSVDSDVYSEACRRVPQQGSNVVLEQIPNSIKLHDVTRFFAQPKLVEFDEKVAVKVMEMSQRRYDVTVGGRWRHVEDVSFGTAIIEQTVSHVSKVDSHDGERVSEKKIERKKFEKNLKKIWEKKRFCLICSSSTFASSPCSTRQV